MRFNKSIVITLSGALVACNVFFVTPLAAKGLSSVYLSATGDSHQTTDGRIGVDISLESENHVFGEAGRTRVPKTPEQNYDLDTRDILVGFGSNPERKYGISGLVGYWGQPGKLSTVSFESSLFARSGSFDFALIPGYRHIAIFVGDSAPSSLRTKGDQFVVRNPYLGFEVAFTGWWPVTLRGGGFFYRYSENMAEIYSTEYAPYFSQSTAVLASGFLSSRSFIEARYDFGRFWLGLEWSQAVNAIDSAKSFSLVLKTEIEVIKSWNLGAELGRTSFDSGSNQFLTLQLIYFWNDDEET